MDSSLSTTNLKKALEFETQIKKAEKVKPWIYVNVTLMIILVLDVTVNNAFLRIVVPQSTVVSGSLLILVEKLLLIVIFFNCSFLIYCALKPAIIVALYPPSFSFNVKQMTLLGLPKERSNVYRCSLKKPETPNVLNSSLPTESSSFDLTWLFRTRRTNVKSSSGVNDSFVSGQSNSFISGNDSFQSTSYKEETYEDKLARLRRARSCSPFISGANDSFLSNRKSLKSYLRHRRAKDGILDSSFGETSLQNRSDIVISSRRQQQQQQITRFFDCSSANESFQRSANSSFNQSFNSNLSNGSLRVDFSKLVGQIYKLSPVIKMENCSASSAVNAAIQPTLDQPSLVPPIEAKIWAQYGISPEKIDLIAHNCRLWLSKTIFHPMMQEIKEANFQLPKVLYGTAIGTTSLERLRKLVELHPNQLPSVSALLPYLSVTPYQTFLFYRLQGLCRGNCLKEYTSILRHPDPNLKPQSHYDTQTDFDIVLHCFAVYLASKYGPDPLSIDFADFKRRYFSIYSDQPKESLDSKALLLRRAGPEPHLTVMYSNKILDVGGNGELNMFKCIALFFKILDCEFGSRFGHVSLGPAGLNVLWIFG